MSATADSFLVLSSTGDAPDVVPIPRPPLPPFPQPITYEHTLKEPPPPRDLYYYRGNFCGLRIPGAPAVPGSNASNPTCIMACLLDNYPPEIQKTYLATYAGYGYTHLQRSVGHALGYGHSLQRYIDLSMRARDDYGLFCDHWLIANEIPGWAPNQDASYWQPILQPIIEQLLDWDVIDSCCPSWQMDQLQHDAPGNPTISIIAYVAGALPRDVPVYTHWVNEAMAWWKTGGEVWNGQNVHDRFSWWYAMRPYLTGAYHQGDTTMARVNPTEYQGRIRDTLNPFSGDQGKGNMGQSTRRGFAEDFRLVEMECSAQDQFDGKTTEDQGDLTGYILSCTTSDFDHTGMSGYGNGARMPDGSPL